MFKVTFSHSIQGGAPSGANLASMLIDDVDTGERAVTRAIRGVAVDLRSVWRAQVRSGGLGDKLANTIRSASYPAGQNSLSGAAVIWSKAPKLIGAFEAGVLITSQDGFWLAIPTEAAGRPAGRWGRRITPGDWEQRNGRRLRFVYRRGRASLLVADDARINNKGIAKGKGGRRRRDGILTGAQTVVIFFLVPQARLRKRLDLMANAGRIAATLPDRILANWD